MRIVLGVGGGIAASKVCTVLRSLTEAGHDVQVVPTASALRFVGAPTWEALSGHPVSDQVWDDVPAVRHVQLGRQAELVVVAPATADLLARAAHGRADDLLTATLLTARCPVLLAPAMHTEMWQHPATVANVATLRERGIHVLEPASGRLTGADSGPGRLPDPEQIVAAALALVTPAVAGGGRPGDLQGRRVVISAGGTREPLDPVRFLGNRSSGRQGWALATTAAARGAMVEVVAANVALPELHDLPGVTVHRVETTDELQAAVTAAAEGADAVVMAAAVADFRPATLAEYKIKKTDDRGDEGRSDEGRSDEGPVLRLVRTPDVLRGLVAARTPGQLVVGFAAETGDDSGDVLHHARAKLARKGCDLLVVNDVAGGRTFGATDTEVVILDATGQPDLPVSGTKEHVADAVWDAVRDRWSTRARPSSPPS